MKKVVGTISVIVCLPVILCMTLGVACTGQLKLSKHVFTSSISGAYQLFD